MHWSDNVEIYDLSFVVRHEWLEIKWQFVRYPLTSIFWIDLKLAKINGERSSSNYLWNNRGN